MQILFMGKESMSADAGYNRLGAFNEAPSKSVPNYELWTPRQERWQPVIDGAMQHVGNLARVLPGWWQHA